MKRSVLVWSCCAALWVSACGANNVEPNTPDGGGTTDGGSTPDGGGPTDGGGGPGPTGTTVTGKVLPATGGASRSLSVLIPGAGRQPVSVDASGTFTVTGVTPPYDLILADKARRNAVVYQGLTLTTPSFSFDTDSDAAPAHSGKVAGSVTGGSSSNQTQVAFVSASDTFTLSVDNPASYSLDVRWDGANTLPGTLYAFESAARTPPYAPPTRFTAAGQRDNVTLTAGATLSGQNIALSAVTNSSLSGRATLPANYVVSLVYVEIAPKPGQEIELFADITGKDTFTYAVPQLASSTFSLQVFAQEQNKSAPDDAGNSLFIKRGLSAGTTNISVPIPTAPRQDKPADDATDVTRSSVFSWSAFANGVHMLQLQEDKSTTPTPYTLKLYTRATQTSLPDLSPLGITLSANTRFAWQVQGFGPATSVDALVGLFAKGDPIGGTEDFSFGSSALRAFTTTASP